MNIIILNPGITNIDNFVYFQVTFFCFFFFLFTNLYHNACLCVGIHTCIVIYRIIYITIYILCSLCIKLYIVCGIFILNFIKSFISCNQNYDHLYLFCQVIFVFCFYEKMLSVHLFLSTVIIITLG